MCVFYGIYVKEQTEHGVKHQIGGSGIIEQDAQSKGEHDEGERT